MTQHPFYSDNLPDGSGSDASEPQSDLSLKKSDPVEQFVPTDFYPSRSRRKRNARTRRQKRLIVLLLVLSFLLLLIGAGALYVHTLISDPASFFEQASRKSTSAPVFTEHPSDTPQPTKEVPSAETAVLPR